MYFKKHGIIFPLFILVSIKQQANGYLRSTASEDDLCFKFYHGGTTDFLRRHCSAARERGRCCVDTRNVTIGLDLGNCNLTKLTSLSSAAGIKWLNLAGNPFKITKCNSSNFFGDSLEGLSSLQSVYLDNNCTCPGGNELWNHTEFNTTTSTKICEGQINTCQYFNETCPSHSFCSSYGPGFYQCKCAHKWLGYKCLVKDGIPLPLLLGCIAGGMLLLTLVIFLLQLRRKRMHSQGYFWVDGTAVRGSPHS